MGKQPKSFKMTQESEMPKGKKLRAGKHYNILDILAQETKP